MSAAYKSACMEVFCIPTEGDNDADATTHDGIKPGIGVHAPIGTTEATLEAQLYASNFKAAFDNDDVLKAGAIHRDLAQPEHEMRIGIDAVERAIQLQEHFLREILSSMPIVQHA
jgi:hypothetical protein